MTKTFRRLLHGPSARLIVTAASAVTRSTRRVAFAAALLILAVFGSSWLVVRADVPAVASGTWVAAGELITPSGAAAVALADGRMLVMGGKSNGVLTTGVSTYDPASGAWAASGDLTTARAGHAVAILKDGRVLIAGGTASYGQTFDIEIYDPANGTSVHAGDMTLARADLAAATLKDGRVLIVGGSDGVAPLTLAEIFNPATGQSTGVPSVMSVARTRATATTMLDGHVLVAGGSDGANDLSSVEIFDSASGTFFATGAMQIARSGHVAVLLPNNNQVLIAGGMSAGAPVASAELYADWRDGFSSTPNPMSVPRTGGIAGGLKPFDVAFVGGGGATTGEYYGYATVKTDKEDYAPGEIVTISGSGWQPGENVTLKISEDADSHFDWNLTAVADTHGNIINQEFYPRQDEQFQHLGMRFYVMATGAASQALMTFTDGSLKIKSVSGRNFGVTVQPFTGSNSCSTGGGAITSGTADNNGFNTGNIGSGDSWRVEANLTANAPNALFTFVSWSNPNGLIITPGLTSRVICIVGFPSGTRDLVGSYAPSTVLTIAPAAGVYGGTTTLTATLKRISDNSAISGKSVAFTLNGTAVGSAITNAAGVATLPGVSVAGITVSGPNSGVTASFAGDTTFGGATGSNTLTITKASLTVQADVKSKTYDGAVFTGFTATISGFVSGQTEAGLRGSGALAGVAAYSGAGTTAVSASATPYLVTPTLGTLTATNYTFAFLDGNLTISNRAITVTADAKTKTYGDPDPALTYQVTSGSLNAGDSFSGTLTRVAGTSVGTYAIQQGTLTAGPNYTLTFVTANLTIGQKPASVTPNQATKTYGGADPAFTGVLSDFLPADNVMATYTRVAGESVSGSPYAISATLAPAEVLGNYAITSNTASFTITKADATVSVTGYTGVYDGLAHGATGTATGVGGAALSGLGLGDSFTNVPGGTATWTFTDTTGNYNNATGTAAIVITKADATVSVTGYTGVYDAAAHGATGTATGVGGAALSGLGLGDSFTNVPGGTATWTFTDTTGNYNNATGTAAIVITKADATVSVTGYTGVYDAAAHGATGTATGVGGAALSGLGLGDSFTNVPGGTATWTFTDTTGNYNNATGTAAIVITKADATVSVTGYTGVYDGAAHGPTGTATGVGGAALSGLGLGDSFTNVPGGTATWTFTDTTGNYNNATGTAAIVITKAEATVSVTGSTSVFDGNAHGATGTATGIGGAALSGLALGDSFTNVPGGTATWTFTDTTGNYNNASASVAIVITKADATVSVTGYTGVYDGAAHGATGTATGVGGVALSGLVLGDSFTNVPGGTATWTFTDTTGNYNNATGTAAIVITKADATVSVTGYTGVYDAAAHGATGTATGVGGVALSGLVLGDSFTNVPGGTATWTFTDTTGNYNNATGTAAIVITKADATVSVTGYTGVYDAAAHGATGTATGVGGVALSGLVLGDSFTNVPGGTATWTFTDTTGNYNNASASVAIVITKAEATVSVTGSTSVFDGNAHGATGTATGIGGAALSGLVLGDSFTNVPGGTATWTFTDTTGNYNNASASVAIVITKAEATVSVTGSTSVFDGNAHGATGTATGIGGAALSGLVLGDSFTNVPGGTATWTFTDTTGNYNNASASVAIVITKAEATVSVTGSTSVFDGNAHGGTGTATGIGGAALSGLVLGDSFTNVPGGTATWIFTDTTGNYNNATGTAAIVITKANAIIVVTPYDVTYDAAAHTATGTATGVSGEPLAGLDLSGTTHTAAGTTSDPWTFTDVTGNYANASSTVTDKIGKANAVIVVTPYDVTYDAAAHTATGTATGVSGEPLAGLDLSGTTHTAAGTTSDPWTFTDVTGNYANASSTVTDKIGQKAASVTPAAAGKTYGAADPTLTGGLVGFVAADNVTATYSRTAGETVGAYVTSATLAPVAVLGNYDITSNTASFTVTKATLTVTADNKTKLLNAANPALTATHSGFVNGETLATSGVTGAPSLTTTAVINSPVGTYPITAAVGALTSSNYTFTFVNGTLSVLYAWDGFLQPINDTAHDLGTMSRFKTGQTIPAKFDIKDVNGVTVQQTVSPTFNYALIGTGCGATAPDTIDLVYPASTLPIYTLNGGHYQFNWSTKGIAGGLYRIFAKLSDGTTQSVDICLAK